MPFGRLWYGDANAVANAIGYASHFSRSHGAVIRVYDDSGNVIETHEHAGDFKEWYVFARSSAQFPLKRIFNDSAFVGFLPSKQTY